MTRLEIQTLIKSRGLTQTKISRMAGMTPQMLCNLLRGDTPCKKYRTIVAKLLTIDEKELPGPK